MTTTRPTSPGRTYVGGGHTQTPPRPRLSPELIAALATRLTNRDLWLLEVLHEHRVLTTHQIRELAYPSISAATHRMLTLWRLRAVERFRPATPTGSAPLHYVLGPAGATILAQRRDTTMKELGYRLETALALAHSSKLAHLVGGNGLFTALAGYARAHPEAELETWWSERRCTAAWGKIARPDGYGRWRENTRQLDFFVEHDTGSEPLRRLITKLGDYQALAEMTRINTPVLFNLPNTVREQHLHTRISASSGSSLTIATTTPETLAAASGPAGPAWRPVTAAGTTRVRLVDLTTTTSSRAETKRAP